MTVVCNGVGPPVQGCTCMFCRDLRPPVSPPEEQPPVAEPGDTPNAPKRDDVGDRQTVAA